MSPSAEPPGPQVVATDELSALDAVATAQTIATGELAAVEVVEAAIARAEALQPVLHAFASTDFDRARAMAASRGLADGALAGVPSAVKDLNELAGAPTTFGTRASGQHTSRRTDQAVQQLLATGVVVIGKSSAPEYGMTATTEPLGFPATVNPWDITRSVGGSSGGAAAMVAARIVPLAHATDGGGSIRIPASCNGLVGLKPSDRRLADLDGNRQMPVHLLASGVVTRTVRDTAAFLAAAERAGGGSLPPVGTIEGPSAQRLRVAVLASTPVAPIDPQVQAAVRRTADQLSDLGHLVEEVALPFDAVQLAEDFLLYWGFLAQTLPWVGRLAVGDGFDAGKLDPWTQGLARNLRRNLRHLPGAIRRLRQLQDTYARLMSRHHLTLTPTVAQPPPPLGWLDVTLSFQEHRARAFGFTPFTPLWNVVGAPAVSLPMALSAAGLPLGVQLGAAVGEEGRLLEVAYELEDAAGFNRPL